MYTLQINNAINSFWWFFYFSLKTYEKSFNVKRSNNSTSSLTPEVKVSNFPVSQNENSDPKPPTPEKNADPEPSTSQTATVITSLVSYL